MISRFTITKSTEQLAAYYSAEVSSFYKPRYNAGPAQLIPVLTSENRNGFSFFYWGLSPERSRNKSISEKILNRHVSDILSRPVQIRHLKSRRCIIPSDGYYFWRPLGKKATIPYRITLKGNQIFSMAGIWEEFETETGETHHTFSLITCNSIPALAEIHSRMPKVLDRTEELLWLDPGTDEQTLLQIINNQPLVEWEFYTVSHHLEDLNRDLPSMIFPAPPADQFGNLTLFG